MGGAKARSALACSAMAATQTQIGPPSTGITCRHPSTDAQSSGTLADMCDPNSRLAEEALELQSAAERLHHNTLDRDCAPLVPAALTAIELTLRILSRTCYAAANTFIPLGANGESMAERHMRAAEEWPNARGGRGPSHEQQARVLSSLNDAGAALRTAAGHCARAGGNLAETMEPMPELHEPGDRPSSSAAG